MSAPPDHPPIPAPKIGVLLINLGTPERARARRGAGAICSEFLSDPRVIEIPQLVWQPILRGHHPQHPAEEIRPRLPAGLDGGRLAARRVSPRARPGRSPARSAPDVIVDHAMRYGQPAIAERIDALKAAGCERILIAPLYPQYCAATTATANDEAFRHLRRLRWQPAVRTLPPYHDDPVYIGALAGVACGPRSPALDFEPQAMLASFHGMPQRTLELGDPYHCHCRKTARLLSEALGRELLVAFQSRFGRAKWLEPATDTMLAELPGKGVTRLADPRARLRRRLPGDARGAGDPRPRRPSSPPAAPHFAYLPCLNDSPARAWRCCAR